MVAAVGILATDDPYNFRGGIAVLLGNGDGIFQPVQTYPSGGGGASEVSVADVNNDGKLDLLVINFCDPAPCTNTLPSSIGVLRGNGDGTFQPAVTYSTGGFMAYGFAVADVNRDGTADILVAQLDSVYFSKLALGVLLGNGDGTFQSPQTYNGNCSNPTAIAEGDVNGDGRVDAIVTCGVVAIFIGNGDGTFQPSQNISSGGINPNSPELTDVNSDGKLDLLVANGCAAEGCGHGGVVSVLLGNGDGTFQPPHSYRSGGFNSTSVATEDVNEDGKLDLVVANNSPDHGAGNKGIGILSGNGDGTFGTVEMYNSGGDGATTLTVADINRDGKGDLLVGEQCNFSCSGGYVGVLLARFKTTTSLKAQLNPSTYGQAVTFIATVLSKRNIAPTGTVIFRNDGKSIGKASLTGGIASLMTKTLPVGALSITASYGGDPDSLKSTSSPLQQTVIQAVTTTTLTSTPNPSTLGQLVKFTATVKSATTIPTGTVTFTAGSTQIGIVTLSGGKASITTSTLPKGQATITAIYAGTANIVGSSGSVVQNVN
jgi:hypothetical protein